MKTLTTLFLICCTITMVAQNGRASVDAKVSEFTKKLEVRNINTYFTAQRYCTGETMMFMMPNGSRCFSQGTYAASYVVWMEDEETRIKKIDNCGMFTSVLVSNDLFNYFQANAGALQNNKVKPYEISNRGGGPILRSEVSDCHRKFQFTQNGVSGSQAYMPYDLTNDSREANLNYEYNKNLEVVQLDAMLDEAIKAAEANPNQIRI